VLLPEFRAAFKFQRTPDLGRAGQAMGCLDDLAVRKTQLAPPHTDLRPAGRWKRIVIRAFDDVESVLVSYDLLCSDCDRVEIGGHPLLDEAQVAHVLEGFAEQGRGDLPATAFEFVVVVASALEEEFLDAIDREVFVIFQRLPSFFIVSSDARQFSE
jgi:hypothetical protein